MNSFRICFEIDYIIQLIVSLCSLKDTSLSLESQQNSREIEENKRRQHQVEQEQQELKKQYPVLQGQVKNITALFEKICHRQTEAEERREWNYDHLSNIMRSC